MHYRCLIVDDEEALSQSTCEYFNMLNVSTAWVSGAKECRAFLDANEVELILLDVNLGGESGFTLCRQIRERLSVPILFISARGGDDDILLALNIGGDDYIQKPYSLNVLLAKVNAMLKRSVTDANLGSIRFGSCTIDLKAGRAFREGCDLQLRAMEFKLLAYLVRNRGRVISKDELFAQVWGDAITGEGTLNVHIRHLRQKIEDDPNSPQLIKTVWGIGYLLEASEPPEHPEKTDPPATPKAPG